MSLIVETLLSCGSSKVMSRGGVKRARKREREGGGG